MPDRPARRKRARPALRSRRRLALAGALAAAALGPTAPAQAAALREDDACAAAHGRSPDKQHCVIFVAPTAPEDETAPDRRDGGPFFFDHPEGGLTMIPVSGDAESAPTSQAPSEGATASGEEDGKEDAAGSRTESQEQQLPSRRMRLF